MGCRLILHQPCRSTTRWNWFERAFAFSDHFNWPARPEAGAGRGADSSAGDRQHAETVAELTAASIHLPPRTRLEPASLTFTVGRPPRKERLAKPSFLTLSAR